MLRRHYAQGMSKWEIPPADPSGIFVKRLRELTPEADRRIKNQHVVSKVILKGFCYSRTAWRGLAADAF